MARSVYSAILGSATSVSDPVSLGTVPENEVWVARFIAMTVGSFLGFIAGGVSVNGADPWLYVTSNAATKIFGVRKQTFYWEGRMVIPSGQQLYAQVEDGDTGDFYISGYKLTNP